MADGGGNGSAPTVGFESTLWAAADALRNNMDAAEGNGERFEEKMARHAATWREQQAEASHLDAAVADSLRGLGYGV